MIINNDLEMALFDNDVYDAWQFIKNTQKTLGFAEYCKDVIIALISRMTTEHEEWRNSVFTDMFKQKGTVKTANISSDTLPSYEIDVVGNIVVAPFLLDKLTKDFFQYCRNAFDSMSQITNAALLASNAKNVDFVDFPKMNDVFNQQTYATAFPSMNEWYQTVSKSDEFIYIDAFSNRSKHTCDIYLKVSMSIMGGENSAEINPFFRKGTPHAKKDITTYLDNIYQFVLSSFDGFLNVIAQEYPKRTYVTNRIHKLLAYQQKFKDSTDSDFALVYIENDAPVENLPDVINVLLLKKTSQNEILGKNCEVNVIYVKPTTSDEYVAEYIATEPVGDDTLLRYRKYKKVIPASDSLPLSFQAMIDWKEAPVFYSKNLFMDITTVSDDDSFLWKVKLP